MPATAVYDANVLYPNTLRDLLIRLARAGLVHARWTEQILDEMAAAIRRTRSDIGHEKIQRLRELMDSAVRDCKITGHEDLVSSVVLPDKDDRHVLAAAIAASAQLIITWNTKDFPPGSLAMYGVRAQTPDDFVSELIAVARSTVWSCVQQIADARTRRPQTVRDILAELERNGLIRSASALATEPAG